MEVKLKLQIELRAGPFQINTQREKNSPQA